MSDVTRILNAIDAGDPLAADQLLPLVYQELRRLAGAKLATESPGQTLQATALVHEAYLRLVGPSETQWDSRGHFFAAAAEAMRRILVDSARQKLTRKHGGDHHRVELDEAEVVADRENRELLALNDALEALQQLDPIKAQLVKLKYFAGLTTEQAADAMGIGVSTAHKYWAYAKCWLRAEVSDEADSPGNDADRASEAGP